MTQMFENSGFDQTGQPALPDAPLTHAELAKEFPPIEPTVGESRLLLATNVVFNREYAPHLPAALNEATVARKGVMGVLRRRGQQVAPAPEGMVTRMCDPVTADLTTIIWRGIQQGKPSEIIVSDRSPITSDPRRRYFGPRQTLTIDGATGIVLGATVEHVPGILVESEAPKAGANLFEFGNVIERSLPVNPSVIREATNPGLTYTRQGVMDIVARHMGPDWANQHSA